MYDIKLLNSTDATSFASLTYPILRPRLQALLPQGNHLAMGIQHQDHPIGLILVELINQSSQAEILSLYVAPAFRNQGIAQQLITNLEQLLPQHRCHQIKLKYLSSATTPVLERCLAKLGWSTPRLRSEVFSGDAKAMQQAPWFNRYPLPNLFTVFRWQDLTEHDRTQLQTLQYPQELSPFTDPEMLELTTSFGLRYHNHLVGWVITHRLDCETIRYTSLFVHANLQAVGRAISLLCFAIDKQAEQNIPKGMFMVFAHNQPMLKFVRRRMMPYLSSSRQSWQSQKSLLYG
jgi:GNAT superfamily N-acetyltransferase